MKKLIAISVVFALLASVAFAADVSGSVIGTVNLVEGSTAEFTGLDAELKPVTESAPITASGGMNRLRLEASGESEDGSFGGWIRAEAGGFAGYASWKPLDQFKLIIGGNGGDGFFGKEGITGWGFYEGVYDTGIVFGNNVWGNGNNYGQDLIFRDVFFGGFGGNGALLTITPSEMASINIVIPFIDESGKEAVDVFMKSIVQVDLNLEGIGNIALTYKGGLGSRDGADAIYVKADDTALVDFIDGLYDGLYTYDEGGKKYNPYKPGAAMTDGDEGALYKLLKKGEVTDPGKFFVYYGGEFGPLGLDVGVSYTLASKVGDESYNNPIGAGLGLKYAVDAFGVNFRLAAKIPMEDGEPMRLLADVLPYYAINDNLKVFASIGVGFQAAYDTAVLTPVPGVVKNDSVLGWHFNPYLQITEGSASFYAGIKVMSDGKVGKDADGKETSATIGWAVPLALAISF